MTDLARLSVLLVAALTAGSGSPVFAQSSGEFIVLSGADTVSLERFNRGPDRLTGEIETRVNTRRSRVTYSVLNDPRGRPRRLEYSLTVPQMGLSTAEIDIGRDSAIGPVMYAERESEYRGMYPVRALPVLTPLSIAMLEDVVDAARADRAGSEEMPIFSWGNERPMGGATLKVMRVNDSTFDVPEMGGLRLVLDRQGRVVSGSGVTSALTIVRAPLTKPVVTRALSASAPGRAPTPPMGWNSWNKFGCRIDETLIRSVADAMVTSGMLAAGYHYLNIDDCWEQRTRAANGDLVADTTRFSSGMPALVSYIHSKGLRVGIYSSGGTATCQGRPATLDHEAQDARLFAKWEIDYVKYDNCHAENRPEQTRFATMIDAVKAAGRPTIFSICEWGEARPWLWGRQTGGQLWRTTEDIRDSWFSMIGILEQQIGLDAYSGPDGWNDPDMLEVGNGKMTNDEYVAHFSLWALLNAPLIAGNDVRSMDSSTRQILLNPDVIAVDQDWGGRQGFRLRDDGAREVWAKPMADGGWTVVLLNRATTPAPIRVAFSELGLKAPWWKVLLDHDDTHRVKDLWTGETSQSTGSIVQTVPGHAVVMLRIN